LGFTNWPVILLHQLGTIIVLLKNDSRVISCEPIILTESHEQLKASNSNELTKLPSSLSNSDDACATNSTSYEASILKENVELRAQLDLLTTNYGKLEENIGKLSSSHEDLLASHDRIKLAHESIMSKVTSSEPHMDICTTSQKAILHYASPSNSFTYNIATSCDELLSFPCCSNNKSSTSSSNYVVTNHVEEIEELKAQVTSLKKDLVKCHEEKSKLDNMLSVQKILQ
jgi:chromosome segregation ATPase